MSRVCFSLMSKTARWAKAQFEGHTEGLKYVSLGAQKPFCTAVLWVVHVLVHSSTGPSFAQTVRPNECPVISKRPLIRTLVTITIICVCRQVNAWKCALLSAVYFSSSVLHYSAGYYTNLSFHTAEKTKYYGWFHLFLTIQSTGIKKKKSGQHQVSPGNTENCSLKRNKPAFYFSYCQ